jgi:hypothetical protein
MIAGTADAWTRFLDALAKQSPSLAETLRTRGKLADLSSARAVIKLSNLREHEKALVFDARNQRLATQAFSELVGNELQLAFEDQSALKHQKDAFTGKVAELFDGRIEDEA